MTSRTASTDIESTIEEVFDELYSGIFKTPVQKLLQGENKRIARLKKPVLAFFLASLFKDSSSSVVFIMPQQRDAQQLYDETASLFEECKELQSFPSQFLYFPTRGILPYTHSVADAEREGHRAKTLSNLARSSEKHLVITSVEAATSRIPSREVFIDASISLKRGDLFSLEKLKEFLAHHGYERVELVEIPGQFSIKGGIIDIFCPAYFNPLRIDTFGDEIESLKFFDPLSQVSFDRVDEVGLFPRRDLILSPEERKQLSKKAEALLEEGMHLPAGLSSEHRNDGLYDLFPLVIDTSTLFEFFETAPTVVHWQSNEIIRKIANLQEERQLLADKNHDKVVLDQDQLFIYELPGATFEVTNLPVDDNDLVVEISDSPTFKSRISSMVEVLNLPENRNKSIYISSNIEAQRDRIEHVLRAYKERSFGLKFIMSAFKEGFAWQKGLFLTDLELFGKSLRSKRISKSTTEIIESFVDLREGDYIVHINYGIGRFMQLKRMTVAGTERDFLQLEFGGSDKLFVPLEQLNLVHRYIGNNENPRLDLLGKKSSWEKTKARVKEDIEKVAEQLLELYARREKSKGIQFPPDSSFQEEFEAAFTYEETDHQMAAITEVKSDMESEKSMDRPVCGDVGFGKTEVAIRAAFKAVMAGRQVAVLCPTTILALQHFNTFSERFQTYPVTIELMSRFRSPAENKQSKEKLKSGKIDIIIGTHSLLAEDISYYNIGLLVVDEEQRFGVVHKESIKQMKANIDCLTLTATPIPRTLQLSLVGIRDLSLINTPPRGRQKIETFVLEENDEVIRRTINEELKRNGQVYMMHNKVKTITAQADRIRQLCPRARVAVLHGQMSEDEIENVMIEFYSYHYDVLVTTTIIESGIDIPNVNTLLVLDAQNFGLSQLYQIKGRVGRSGRQAFAYFFYPKDRVMTELANKRLSTLQEYVDLGSGFKIAMKDLEIRGAGSILGKEQSGDIVDVGFELYVQLLQEKLAELRHESRDDFECQVTIAQDFYFPDDYIADTRQKMEFYKKISAAREIASIESVRTELEDRFGKPPVLVENMIAQEEIRILGSQLRLEKISFKDGQVNMYASPGTSVKIDNLMHLIQNDERFSLDDKDPRKVVFKPANTEKSILEFKSILEYIV